MVPHILETVLKIFYNNDQAPVGPVNYSSALDREVPVPCLVGKVAWTPIYQLASKNT